MEKWSTRKIIVVSIVATILLVLAAYALRWIFKPLELTDPDEIERLSQEVNEAWFGLEAQKASIQSIRNKMLTMEGLYGEDKSEWPQGKDDEYLQLQTQLTNLINAYNQSCGAYNARWGDEWQNFRNPRDLPTRCELMN